MKNFFSNSFGYVFTTSSDFVSGAYVLDDTFSEDLSSDLVILISR